MPVEYFIRFQGKCYDVGTRLKFYVRCFGLKSSRTYVGTIERFEETICIIKGDDGKTYSISTMLQTPTRDNNDIVEIIKPVYYVEKAQKSLRICPPAWGVEIGWVWYIIIMVVGTIFNDRLMIWIFASLIFFGWKNGFLNGGNK
jgi:hypothetical protein